MKKFLILLAALTLVLGVAGQAGAAVKFGATGFWQHQWTFNSNITPGDGLEKTTRNANKASFDSDASMNQFYGYNRIRTTFSVEANAYLKGSGTFEVGDFRWGASNTTAAAVSGGGGNTVDIPNAYGGAMTTKVNGFFTRNAWLDVKFPGTPVALSTGLMQLTFPAAALGTNPMMNDRAAAAVLSFPAGDVAKISLIFAQPAWNNAATADTKHNTARVFGAIVDLNLGNFSLTPYLAYGIFGHGVADASATVPSWYYGSASSLHEDSTAFFVGAAFKIAPAKELTVGVDLLYGSTSNGDSSYKDKTSTGNSIGTGRAAETAGFLVGVAADYKLSFGTPGAFLWYGSGSKANEDKAGVLPLLGTDGGISRLRLANHGAGRLAMGSYDKITRTGVGSMGIGVQLADVKSLDKLSHTFRAGYIAGTNDANIVRTQGDVGTRAFYGLSKDISAFEIDIDSTLKIIDNLNIILDIAYLAPSLKDAPANNLEFKDAGFSVDLGLYFNF